MLVRIDALDFAANRTDAKEVLDNVTYEANQERRIDKVDPPESPWIVAAK